MNIVYDFPFVFCCCFCFCLLPFDSDVSFEARRHEHLAGVVSCEVVTEEVKCAGYITLRLIGCLSEID
jgi:hypothetical protein